jgi:hypothetical protein
MQDPSNPVSLPGERITLTALEALARALAARGWITRLHTPPGRMPSLYIQNPASAMLTEHIYASPADGQWWYWWSWADKITPVTYASQAADAITRVLRTTDAGSPK